VRHFRRNSMTPTKVPRSTFEAVVAAILDGTLAYAAGLTLVVLVRICKHVMGAPPALGPLVFAGCFVVVVATLRVRLRRSPSFGVSGSRLPRLVGAGARTLVALSVPLAMVMLLVASGPHMLQPMLPYTATAIVVAVASVILLHATRTREAG